MGGMNRDEVHRRVQGNRAEGRERLRSHPLGETALGAGRSHAQRSGYDGLITACRTRMPTAPRSVLLVPGVVAGDRARRLHLPGMLGSLDRRDQESHSQCAKELGVKIAIENVGNNFITTPEQAVEYLDAINSEWVGWHFDIGNVGPRRSRRRTLDSGPRQTHPPHSRQGLQRRTRRTRETATRPNCSTATPTGPQ